MSDTPERIWLRWADAEDYAIDVEEEDIPAGMECFVRLDIFDALKAENERLRAERDTMLGLLMEARAYVAERDELRAKVQQLRAMIDGSTASDATTTTADNDAPP